MDYVNNSIHSIRNLRSWAHFITQFPPSEHKRRNNSQFLNLLEQLWGTENLLCHLSSPTLKIHRLLLRELDDVIGRAIALVKEVYLCSELPREHYSGEHYLEVFLELRWWTWVVICEVADGFIRTTFGREYFVIPKGVLDPASSRLPSFVEKLHLWWSGSARHLPSYRIEACLRKAEGLSTSIVWLTTTSGRLLNESDVDTEYIIERKALVPVLGAYKPPRVRERKVDLTQVILGVSHSALVIKCEDSGTEYALKRVNGLDLKQPILADLFHPHVVRLLDFWRENGFLFLAMELMEGDLAELIARRLKESKMPFTMNVAVDFMLQIAKTMLYLHDLGLTHPHLQSSDVLFKVAKDKSRLGKNESHYLLKLGDFRFYAKNDFKSVAQQNVYQFGLICVEVLSNEPLRWRFEERILGMSQKPKDCFDALRDGSQSTIPELLTECIGKCLGGTTQFSEVVVMLLLAQLQVLTKAAKEPSAGISDGAHLPLAKQQDVWSKPGYSSRSSIIPEAALADVQKFPEVAEGARSVLYKVGKDLDDVKRASAPELIPNSSSHISEVKGTLHSRMGEDLKLTPVKDDFGASHIPVYLSSTDFEEGGYMESLTAGLDLCDKQIQESVNLLSCVNIFKFLSKYLVETLSSSVEVKFTRYRRILGLLHDRHRAQISTSLRNSISFCFESLVGLARQFQFVVNLLMKCGSPDWYKSALELADVVPAKHIYRWSRFSLLIQNCEFSLDLVELAFHALEKLLTEGVYTVKDATFKWSEERCRMVLQIGSTLDRKYTILEEPLLETCRNLEDMDLTALTEKLQKLIEFEKTEKRFLQGSSDVLKIANCLYEKLKASTGMHHPVTFTDIHPSLKYLEFLDYGSSEMVAHKWYGMKVAVKSVRGMDETLNKNRVVSKNKITGRTGFEQEVGILAMVQHPNVVRLIGCGFVEEIQVGFLVMELMNRDLRAVIDARLKVLPEGSSPFSFIVALDLMVQIAQAMRYLREHNIPHRDLKAKNILVNICKPLGTSSLVNSDSANTNLLELPVSVVLPHTQENYVAKLADFGLAKYQTQTSRLNTSMAGTAGWRAPEVFYVRDMEVAQEYTWPADVYSYAMTCYEILTGKIPFEDTPTHMLHDKIMAGVRPSLENLADIPEVTGDFKEFLNNCWATDPGNRPSFEYIEKRLWEFKVLAILSGFERQIMETSRALGGGSTLSSEPILEFKHKIFLSHSGAQRDFVEILFEALKQRSLFAFFDKQPRSESIAKSILSAAKQCSLAVVVISEDYFMSKWPMMELASFVQAMTSNNTIKILPIYYGLSRSEFTDKKRQERWFIKWKEWATIDTRVDIEEWKDGLRVLHSINGMEYNRASQASIVAFRDEIVFNISRLVAPNIKWDDSHVQGRSYICQAIYKMFHGVRSSHPHEIDVVGLYGVGGIGKTTICNTLCNELFSEFEGRVCCLEFGDLSLEKNLRQALINLTSTNVEFAQLLDESECMVMLCKSLRKKKTFLAIDNVQDNFESITRVTRLLQAPFHEGSKLIVTARSAGTLERLGINRDACFEMPALEHEHATNIFLYHAAHGKQFALDEEKHAIDLCVKRCYFHKGYEQGGHYHPLALKVLGSHMSILGTKPLEWVKYLDDRYENPMKSERNPLFDILRSSFDSLQAGHQTLFFDVIFFAPTIHLSPMTEPGDMKEWLCLVYQEDEDEIKHRLMHLTRQGLLEDVDLTSGIISIHDLYREFARRVVNAELDDFSDWAPQRWLYVENRNLKELVEMTRSGRCWEGLIRVGIYQPGTPSNRFESLEWSYSGSLEGIEWSYFSNLEVLNLAELPLLRGVLNLKELRRLRSLQLYSVTNLDRLEGLEGLRDLTYFRWFHDAYGSYWNVENTEDVHTHVGEFPASLKVLQIEVGVLLGPDVLARCQNLCKVVLYDVRASNLDFSNCSSLKTVKLYQIRNLHTLLGLTAGWASRLESLVVQRCKDLVAIPGLDHLIGLRLLVIEHCKLKEVPDLQNLTTLQVLRLGGEQFPKLKARLEVPGVPCIPKQLRELICQSLEPTKVPNISGFEKLEVLDLCGEWTCMEDVGELPALRCLDLSYCTLSSRLPDLSKSMNLEVLNLEHCEIELHEEDVRMLASLPLLQPVPVGGQGKNCVRLDLARRKVLRCLSSAGEAPASWLAWKELEWEESDLGILPIRIGQIGSKAPHPWLAWKEYEWEESDPDSN